MSDVLHVSRRLVETGVTSFCPAMASTSMYGSGSVAVASGARCEDGDGDDVRRRGGRGGGGWKLDVG